MQAYIVSVWHSTDLGKMAPVPCRCLLQSCVAEGGFLPLLPALGGHVFRHGLYFSYGLYYDRGRYLQVDSCLTWP